MPFPLKIALFTRILGVKPRNKAHVLDRFFFPVVESLSPRCLWGNDKCDFLGSDADGDVWEKLNL